MRYRAIPYVILAFGCFCVGLAAVSGQPARSVATDDVTEFGLAQNITVNTLVCASYDFADDFTQYGHLVAAGCTSTGAIPSQPPSTTGHFQFDVRMANGQRITINGCRVDSHTAVPGYKHYAINCTY